MAHLLGDVLQREALLGEAEAGVGVPEEVRRPDDRPPADRGERAPRSAMRAQPRCRRPSWRRCRARGTPFTDTLKRRSGIETLRLTRANRDDLAKALTDRLRSAR